MSRAAPGAGTFLLALLAAAGGVRAGEIDSQRSGVGFSLVTSWREAVDGSFPVFEGRLTQLPDGRQQVRLALSAADVVIHGSARNTYFARGNGFFEAERHPWITFESEPFAPDLLVEGGELPGLLAIRDVQRREVFSVLPSECARPARDCAVFATGTIDRGHYGMTRWGFVIGRKVGFRLRIYEQGPAG